MARKPSKKKDPSRVTLCTAAGKIVAYRAVGKEKEAKEWANRLVLELMSMGLLNARNLSAHEFAVDLRSAEALAKEASLRAPFG